MWLEFHLNYNQLSTLNIFGSTFSHLRILDLPNFDEFLASGIQMELVSN